ncbi:hypothetical protein OG568_12685 [Streptomyces sp. NBC_01450]|nr:hypothetical protein [Streptomyces sp. NBC_01450]
MTRIRSRDDSRDDDEVPAPTEPGEEIAHRHTGPGPAPTGA